jgi:formate dehydrogenase beta subunit
LDALSIDAADEVNNKFDEKPIHFMRPSAFNKGRQVQPSALRRLREIFHGFEQRDKQYLIEALHLIQDAEKCLSADLLAACAQEFKLSQAEVFEVATFYHHFDVVKEGEQRPPQTTIRVCESLSCSLAGAEKVIAALELTHGGNSAAWGKSGVRVQRVPCIGRCEVAPAAAVGKTAVSFVDAENPADFQVIPKVTFQTLEDYVLAGGFAELRKVLKTAPALALQESIGSLKASNLRGLGGAGFPAASKWAIVAAQSGDKLLVVNADEGEPGTFKDRHYLERKPHQFFEGMLIAAYLVGTKTCYIYLRDEYPQVANLLANEMVVLQKWVAANFEGFALPTIELRRGAGAYICGEESALIESIEGKRGMPRLRPPYVAQIGLFGKPTLVHNVETLFWVPDLLAKPRAMMRSYSVSGRVRNPGVKLAPAGISVRSLIDDYCGGMLQGHVLYAYLPGGASGGILPASLDQLPLDFDKLQEYGCFIGSAAVIVLSQADSARDAASSMMKFFQHESCGQCTPCRVGTGKAVGLMAEPQWDVGLATELSSVMADASICGLGQAAPNPMLSVIRYFSHEVSHDDSHFGGGK